jgi:ABC-type glutathione transport system ATPase component
MTSEARSGLLYRISRGLDLLIGRKRTISLAEHIASAPMIVPKPELLLQPTMTAPAVSGNEPSIKRRAVAKSFNAGQPVASRVELFGRDTKLDALAQAVVDGEHHALIFGARGSGKTSLVRVFADYADRTGFVVLYAA